MTKHIYIFGIVLLFFTSCKKLEQNNPIEKGLLIWDTKNLNVSNYRNGDAILIANNTAEWKNFYDQGYGACWPTSSGKLYNKFAMNDVRGLAPIGFHIPHDFEWLKLIERFGGTEEAVYKMKNTSGWSCNGNNISKFSALECGFLNDTLQADGWGGNDVFYFEQQGAWWWSFGGNICRINNYCGLNDYVYLGSSANSKMGYSVRCVKD